ncbi:hypothetical protein BGX34_011977 [Mortierella sp. NVP85]|nr:hypothetical protein BGX34_011977 [Mortierella sp. NVP85]
MKIEALALEDTVILKDALYPILRQLVTHRKKYLEAIKEHVSANESAKIRDIQHSCHGRKKFGGIELPE